MNGETVTKVVMVVALLGLVGLTAKLGFDARKTEQSRSKDRANGIDEVTKTEIRQVIRDAIHAHRQLDFDRAEKLLVAASEKYPRVAAVWLNLGICYRSVDKLDAADRAFARVLELNAEDWDAIAERATLRLQRGQTDEAIEMLAIIPANLGQVNERLRADPLWLEVKDDRLNDLRDKHGVVADGDTSVDATKRIVKSRQEAAAQDAAATETKTRAPEATPADQP